MKKKEERSEGLTLVELMVALAIFGIIVTGIIFYLLSTSQKTGRRVDIAVTVQQSARMAMEQLTRELRQAGFRRASDTIFAPNCSATFIEFESDITGDGTPERIAYTYDAAARQLRRRVDTRNPGVLVANGACGQRIGVIGGAEDVIAENVSNFNISYFVRIPPASTPTETATPGTVCDNLNNIERIRVRLESRVDNPYPGGAPVTITLISDITTRNTGVTSGCEADNIPPGAPPAIGYLDTCLCSRLQINWGAVAATDLVGYRIFVGVTSGIYDRVIDVGAGTLGYTIDQNNMNLRFDSPTAYYIGVAAVDACHNVGTITEVHAVNTGCNVPGDAIPPAPTSPEQVNIATVEAVSGTASVTLRWDAIRRVSDNTIRDDLDGYRIYRSFKDSNGVQQPFTCINCAGGGSQVTVPFMTGQARYEYVDNAPELVGCQIYDYYIVGLNCRGESPQTPLIHGDGAGTEDPADNPAGANTRPQDITPPADPTNFVSSPGSNEVYLTFTTPNDVDFNGILILFSTTGFPPEAVNGQRPAGNVAYEQANLIRNNTYTYRQTGLANGTKYYYRAYSIDRCGNYSNGAAATSTAQPCNDGTSPPYPWYHGSPNPPVLLSLAYCKDKVTITWSASKGANPLDGTHDNDIPDDLMLYYIYRDGVKIKEVAASTQAVDSDFDPNAYAGKALVYEVSAVDCVPNESIKSNALTAYPGSVIVDLTRKDRFVTRGANHNEFFFLIRNTSAAIATVQSMTLTYDQPAAFVQKVDFFTVQGDAPFLTYTFEKTSYEDTLAPIDKGTGTEVVFSDRPQLAGQGTFPGDSYRVVRVVFTDSTGTDTSAADMRGVNIKAKFKFFLGGNAAGICEDESAWFAVPQGPVFTGTAQLPPASFFLPSTTLVGSYIVEGGKETNVETFVTTDSGATPITVTLHYTVTAKTQSTAPAKPYGPFLTMLDVGGTKFILFDSNTGAGATNMIPPQDGNRVWYYIDADDAKGNTNRDPSTKAYTYDQTIVDPCSSIPKNPATLIASACPGIVRLSWSPVTQNTNNTTITDLAGYKLYRFTDATFSTIAPGFPQTLGPNVLTYDDTMPLLGHYYKVTAFDTCATGAKESSLSTAPSQATPPFGSFGSPSVTATPNTVNPFISGVVSTSTGRFSITIVDPNYACNLLSNEVAWVHDCSSRDDDWFRVIENGDTGVFQIDSAYYSGRDYLQAHLNSFGSVSNLDLNVSKSDSITICWNREVAAGSEGTACTPCVASTTVSVTPDPCQDTPNAPTNLTGSRGTGNSRMNMSWTAPTTNTDGSALTDLIGYNIYRRLSSSPTWVLVGQVTSTSVTNYDVGANMNTADYFFAVTAADSCSPPLESAQSNAIGPF